MIAKIKIPSRELIIRLVLIVWLLIWFVVFLLSIQITALVADIRINQNEIHKLRYRILESTCIREEMQTERLKSVYRMDLEQDTKLKPLPDIENPR